MKPNQMLKVVAHISCWIPLILLIYGAINRTLGADPQEEMLHQLGLWVLIFILLGLTITPINRLLGLPSLVRYRRLLGLYAAFYLLLHIAIFFVFYLEMSLSYLWDEIIERPYVTVGMLATILMLPLVVTSTKSAQRRLGRKWKKLHQLVYPIGILGIVHFIWQSKSDLNEPLLYAFWLAAILFFRIYWSNFRNKS